MKQTQGRFLIELLKKRPHTYGDMLQALKWQSTSPWRRVTEQLKPNERLLKSKNGKGLVMWRVRVER